MVLNITYNNLSCLLVHKHTITMLVCDNKDFKLGWSSPKLFSMSIPTSVTLTNSIIYQMCMYHTPYPRGAIGTPHTWATNLPINSSIVKRKLQKVVNPFTYSSDHLFFVIQLLSIANYTLNG